MINLNYYYTLRSHHNYLWYISFSCGISCLVAIYNNKQIYAITSGGAFLTSINYWRKPENNWKRTLDLCWIALICIYQFWDAHKYEAAQKYYYCILLAISNYPLSNYLLRNEYYVTSTFCHGLIHIIANIGNIILYSSSLKSP